MQLYASDRVGKKISAYSAVRGEDYFCFECLARLRVRGGLHQKLHFFHLADEASCRQSQKSELHIAVQKFITQAIGESITQLERRFSEIERVADVAWEARKLVIEVQCSPISAQEVEARTRDYESIGWGVIWILSDKRFNQKRVSAAELFLQNQTHYYTDGRTIYDQCHLIRQGVRCGFSTREEVWLDKIEEHVLRSLPKDIPEALIARQKSWRHTAVGDHLCHAYNLQKARWQLSMKQLKEKEKVSLLDRIYAIGWLKRAAVSCRSFWHMILEGSCR